MGAGLGAHTVMGALRFAAKTPTVGPKRSAKRVLPANTSGGGHEL